mmetsp:Transcript_34767/g.86732  ORF Transcript_34767/g.86732 Transcript_34767/m.86732 type:complete len:841 (-) Transcript_34767:189-2711(-)
MRIMIKGGVWKNTEDEILKAAVMKYGLNQWSRISSLLTRKSAKQCKARWAEWLDPSIKKTEWSREEEEKLLHLAKLMPTQWRTIAPIVGRTAAQCLEHYERLLDQATRKDDDEYNPMDDPRRLRPGEIDPHPETKPARPDATDMDEDEKEMLSEARARLANTRGKKAKRKAREKQLDEARRLAQLQKRRELKAAGIELSSRGKKLKGIDYANEVPFERRVPQGFFDTLGEDARAAVTAAQRGAGRQLIGATLDQLNGPRRDEAEERARAEDKRRQKRQREDDLPGVLARINAANAAALSGRRGPLALPPPQVTDSELDEIARAGQQPAMLAVLGGGGGASALLLASYEQTPVRGGGGGTPALLAGARSAAGGATPKLSRAEWLQREAQTLAALNNSATPLAGGANPLINLGDFGGITPQLQRGAGGGTPSVSGGSVQRVGAGGSTPQSSGCMGYDRSAAPTPSRDALGINTNQVDGYGGGSVDSTPLRGGKMITMGGKGVSALAKQLRALPAPRNEYALELPTLPNDAMEEDDENAMPAGQAEDMDERRYRMHAADSAAARAAGELLNAALRRELPRPLVPNRDMLKSEPPVFCTEGGVALLEANNLVRAEVLRLLEDDAQKEPIEEAHVHPATNKRKRALLPLTPAERVLYTSLISKALLAGQKAGEIPQAPECALFASRHELALGALLYVPSEQKYCTADSLGPESRLSALSQNFQLVRSWAARETKRGDKAEKKGAVLMAGYVKRADVLHARLTAGARALREAEIQADCFGSMAVLEEGELSRRLTEGRARIVATNVREATLQSAYATAMMDKEATLDAANRAAAAARQAKSVANGK